MTIASQKLQVISLKTCPACSSSKSDDFAHLDKTNVKKCFDCGLKYLDPCLSPVSMMEAYQTNSNLESFHEFHKGYSQYGGLSKSSVTRMEFIRELDLVDKFIARKISRSIFDVGCGNGFFLATARERGWEVAGIESSAESLAAAKTKFSLELTQGDFGAHLPENEFYDVVSFLDVLEHLPNPIDAIYKASEMLRAGGLVLVAVPNDESFSVFIMEWVKRLTFGKVLLGVNNLYFLEHVSYFNKSNLSRLFERNGFKLRGYFYSSTDLKKYKLSFFNNIIAKIFLFLGKIFGKQNRLIAVFQK